MTDLKGENGICQAYADLQQCPMILQRNLRITSAFKLDQTWRAKAACYAHMPFSNIKGIPDSPRHSSRTSSFWKLTTV